MIAQALEADVIKGIPESEARPYSSVPRHNGGRPVRLNVERFLRICDLIQQGKCNTAACKIEGVDYSGFRAHIRRKPWWQKRYLHADQVRDEFLRDLYLGIISQHSKENWQAAAWLCERRWPQYFALHFKDRDTPESGSHPIGDAIPAERLAEYGRLMIEFAEENRVKQAQAVELPESSQA